MIEINLLPHREAKRVADVRDSVGLLLLGLVLVMGGVWFVDSGVTRDIEKTEASVRQLKANIEKFKPQQAQVAAFKAKKKQLQVKLDVIHGLDRARTGPLRLMDEISIRTPEPRVTPPPIRASRLPPRGRAATLLARIPGIGAAGASPVPGAPSCSQGTPR